MITYATNYPEIGYELMVSGDVPERFDLTKYTHVWTYDPDEVSDDPPDWAKYPAWEGLER
jgi:hypothetical protein